ncbi:MAG: hypothetical protein ABR589_03655 [Chthoniobacterales bacterium]
MNSVDVFKEPVLEFASGQLLQHPRDGLTLFGPVDSAGIEKPAHVPYGVVGTKAGLHSLRAFLQTMRRPIPTDPDLDRLLWPDFPGFEEAFHTVLPNEPAWTEEIDDAELTAAAENRDDHQRVFSVVSLFLHAIRAAKKSDDPIRFFVVVVPEIVYAHCRPQSRFEGKYGRRVGKREQRVRSQIADFFDSYEPEQYAFSIDFRRQIKARVMEMEIPIQIVRESTLRLDSERRFGIRRLTPLSDRAWNLSTALYYKAGRRPWKLSGVREGVCYIGVSFKNTDSDRNACCAAQMFLNDGDGVVFLGDEGRWYSERRGEYHLNKESAARLLSGVLETYRSQHGKPLTEIFLHSRSTVNEEEFGGYQSACPPGVRLFAVRVAPERLGLRLYRGGTRPVLRGTFWRVSPKRGFLWGSGFKPRLRTYDGSDVPQPLCIDVQHGAADVEQVARDIFALTKLNYNCCKLGENQPVTIHFSGAVGEILVTNRLVKQHKPNFKYYI